MEIKISDIDIDFAYNEIYMDNMSKLMFEYETHFDLDGLSGVIKILAGEIILLKEQVAELKAKP